MARETSGLTLEDLAERVGVPVRTIRFYIAEGLLPSPEGRGKAASYGEEHLLRLRLIRRLVDQRVPLAEQRERLSHLSLDDVRSLLAEADRRTRELQRAEAAPSPKEYVLTLLKRAQAHRGPPPPAGKPPATPPATPPAVAAEPAAFSAPSDALAPPASAAQTSATPAPATPSSHPQPPSTAAESALADPGSPWSAAPAGTPAGEVWQRWELAPGVELQVRADAERRHGDLIERLLGIAHAYLETPAE
jgi:DNA-binding transcriptional MerR regulator